MASKTASAEDAAGRLDVVLELRDERVDAVELSLAAQEGLEATAAGSP
jgi:hypothetical protein